MSQEFFPAGIILSHHHGSASSGITPGMNNKSVGGRGSETSHPIDMINQSFLPSLY
jgi:hypothetical protein